MKRWLLRFVCEWVLMAHDGSTAHIVVPDCESYDVYCQRCGHRLLEARPAGE